MQTPHPTQFHPFQPLALSAHNMYDTPSLHHCITHVKSTPEVPLLAHGPHQVRLQHPLTLCGPWCGHAWYFIRVSQIKLSIQPTPLQTTPFSLKLE